MRIFPLSETALTVEFGNEISPELNDRAIALAEHFNKAPFRGLIEAVPAYASVTLFYDLIPVRREFPNATSAFAAVKTITAKAVDTLLTSARTDTRVVEIPMIASEENSPDLARISEHSGLSPEEVIRIFTDRTYRVHMIGFLPGFAYMGEVDERIATPRLSSPRTSVPKGSIGIAGKQTGIYPLDSPGGWNIIARTDTPIFDPTNKVPCLLKPGDGIRFVQK